MVLVIPLLKVAVVCVVVLSPEVFGLSVAIQLKVDPMFADNGMLTVLPLQMVAEEVLVITGTGFTVTVAVAGNPAHDPIVGVMVYVAVPELVLVVDNVCAIVDPVLPEAPVTPLCATVHVKVVPVTLLVSAMEVVPPEQSVCAEGVTVTTGVGLTVTLTVCAGPVQPPPVDTGETV